MKKAQGLSINVIIIVAIALIVLVVLIAIFTGRMGGFVTGVGETNSCDVNCQGIAEGMSGTVTIGTSCAAGERLLSGNFDDVDSATEVCCCKTPTVP